MDTGGIRFHIPHRHDFRSHDAEAIVETVRRLTDAAFRFNHLAITTLGGRSGREREPGAVERVVGAAFQTLDGEDIYPDPFQKAAMLWRGITQGHPFTDGNKRTGFILARYYLEQYGLQARDPLSIDQVYEFSRNLSKGTIREVDEIAEKLRDFWKGHSRTGE